MLRELVIDWRAELAECSSPLERFCWVLVTPFWVPAYLLAALIV
jgi:hypothetical protein